MPTLASARSHTPGHRILHSIQKHLDGQGVDRSTVSEIATRTRNPHDYVACAVADLIDQGHLEVVAESEKKGSGYRLLCLPCYVDHQPELDVLVPDVSDPQTCPPAVDNPMRSAESYSNPKGTYPPPVDKIRLGGSNSHPPLPGSEWPPAKKYGRSEQEYLGPVTCSDDSTGHLASRESKAVGGQDQLTKYWVKGQHTNAARVRGVTRRVSQGTFPGTNQGIANQPLASALALGEWRGLSGRLDGPRLVKKSGRRANPDSPYGLVSEFGRRSVDVPGLLDPINHKALAKNISTWMNHDGLDAERVRAMIRKFFSDDRKLRSLRVPLWQVFVARRQELYEATKLSDMETHRFDKDHWAGTKTVPNRQMTVEERMAAHVRNLGLDLAIRMGKVPADYAPPCRKAVER